MKHSKDKYIWGLLRIGMGWVFLWTFLDKLFGLGSATEAGKSWLDGVSPTLGFLKFGTTGPFTSIYQSIAGQAVVDWLYMIGLGLVGLALILGLGVRIAGYSGSLMMLLIYTAALPPEHNPFMDEHIIYIIVLIGLTFVNAGRYLGLGQWWSNTKLVQKYKIFE